MKKPIVIKACPCSGTRYISAYLNKAGYRVGHESYQIGGMVGYPATPIKFDLEQVIVGHQVRHPIRVIESSHTFTGSVAWKRMCAFVRVSESWLAKNDLQSLMMIWVLWNELADESCSFTYRVEDQLHILNEHLPKPLPEEGPSITTNTHRLGRDGKPTGKVPDLTMDMLEEASPEWAARLRDLALKYGYGLS